MTMKTNNFAVFIVTHGRADSCLTDKTLRKQNYTGAIYYIVDDEDEQLEQYRKNFGDSVIVFNKQDLIAKTDTIDNGGNTNAVVFARNAVFDIAAKLNLDFFLELDDDYQSFDFRFKDGDQLRGMSPKNLDTLFDATIDFLVESDALTVAYAQGGDFIGGLKGNSNKKALLRKAMNSFFCRTSKPFTFCGRINEDTNMYVLYGSQGQKIFTITDLMINQPDTQSRSGGLTDIYLDLGTYVKSFYSVVCNPAAVRVIAMGDGHYRIHHAIDWNACTPRIINERHRK